MAVALAIPGYEILDLLGKQGTISRYRGRELTSGRTCELSVLLTPAQPTPEQEDRQLRFLDEGRALLGFSHENVVRILDVGFGPQAAWIAQEWMDALPLEEVLALLEGQLSVEQTLAVGVQVGAALGALGLADLVHRDVSPKSILIGRDGQARLTGFGLNLESSYERLSQGEMPAVAGVDYLSPEQVEGELLLTPRADVYGLGATLYRCLAGRVPHGGSSLFTRLRAIVASQPPDVRELNPGVPDALAQLLGRCMEWDADDRPLPQDTGALLSRVAEVDALAVLAALFAQVSGASAARAASGALTVRLRGTDRTIDLPLDPGGRFDVGRAHDAAVSLRFGWVSRQHAVVELTGEGLVLTDLGSSNGTTHNRQRVHGSVILKDGDMVAFGKSSFQVLLLQGEAAPAAKRQCALCGQSMSAAEDEDDDVVPVCMRCEVRNQADRESTLHRIRLALEEARFEIEDTLDASGVFKRFRVRRRKKPFLASAIELGPRAAKLFADESKRALSIKHPGVLPALDLDVRSGVLIVVNQAHEGQTLEELIELNGPLPPEAVISLGQLLCDTLADVLAQGVTHALVRPEMVLLAEDGQPVVLDVGLAPGLVDAGRASSSWAPVPCFEAPELVEARNMTPQGVVYSLGATLSYACTGNPVAETRGGERYDHLPLTMVASVPPALAEVLSQATAPDAADRPADPGALRDALGQLSLAPPPDEGPSLRPDEQTWGSGEWQAFGGL